MIIWGIVVVVGASVVDGVVLKAASVVTLAGGGLDDASRPCAKESFFLKDKMNLDSSDTINEFTESERAFAKLNSYLLAGVDDDLIADALIMLNTLSSSTYSLGP